MKDALQDVNKWVVVSQTRKLSVLSKTQSSYCLRVLPASTQISLPNYCNSSVKMDIASGAHVDLEKA